MRQDDKPAFPAVIALCWVTALVVVMAAFVLVGPDRDRLPGPAQAGVASRP